MADRYPNRPLSADDYDRGGDQYGSGGGESDPLAELARLIGQNDPLGHTARPNPPHPARTAPPREYYPPQPEPYQPPQQQYQPSYEDEESEPPAGPPSWMQRANLQRQAAANVPGEPQQEFPQDDEPEDYLPNPVHPLHRYAAPPAAQQSYPQQSYQEDYREQAYAEPDEQAGSARYDDALYGQLESGAQDFQREPAYPDDPYAYQDGYDEDAEEPAPRRRGGLLTVAAVLALAVVGTGAAFAYRTYVGSARTGEPPIIRADNTPTKIMPPPSDGSGKAPDRLPAGDGTEKLVSREEVPVDVNARAAGPRVVFPPLNQNANPPSPASVSTNAMPATTATPGTGPGNGTMPNNEPRKIRTFSVHGDQPDGAAAPVMAAPATSPGAAPKPALAGRPQTTAPRNAAPASNAPLSLSPDSAQASLPEPRTRLAAGTPTAIAPVESAGTGEGRFLVQVSSQKTEADAQASYRALQRKFPDALSTHSPVIKRADLGGDKGTVYRAMVGPFASRDEAIRFCSSYKTAGGQCYVP